jgi:hypothetical protein
MFWANKKVCPVCFDLTLEYFHLQSRIAYIFMTLFCVLLHRPVAIFKNVENYHSFQLTDLRPKSIMKELHINKTIDISF